MRNDGVSEVIGEILMLAVVVILVAVLASNMGSLFPEFSAQPYATFIGVSADGRVNITHTGGEALNLEEIKIILSYSNLTQIVYTFEDEKLVDKDGKVRGRLHGDGDGLWEFSEMLEIENFTAIAVKIVHPEGIICKMYFGEVR